MLGRRRQIPRTQRPSFRLAADQSSPPRIPANAGVDLGEQRVHDNNVDVNEWE
jgi:hypothetical protein